MRTPIKIRPLLLVLVCLAMAQIINAQSFTMEQIKSYPFPNELTASGGGARIAWAFNERGLRNVWVAEGPDFKARRLTNYTVDDGQELTSLGVSEDGKYVVYVRGGDHGSNFDSAAPVNPALSATQTRVQIWSVPFAGGEPKMLGEGDEPVISPKSDRVVFVKERGIWAAPIDGSSAAMPNSRLRSTSDRSRIAPAAATSSNASVDLPEPDTPCVMSNRGAPRASFTRRSAHAR